MTKDEQIVELKAEVEELKALLAEIQEEQQVVMCGMAPLASASLN